MDIAWQISIGPVGGWQKMLVFNVDDFKSIILLFIIIIIIIIKLISNKTVLPFPFLYQLEVISESEIRSQMFWVLIGKSLSPDRFLPAPSTN